MTWRTFSVWSATFTFEPLFNAAGPEYLFIPTSPMRQDNWR
jgi:hypothetical protein